MISASWQIQIDKPPDQVFDRPSNLGFDARNPKCDALVRFHFVPAGESSTTVSCNVDLAFKGSMKFLAPLMAGKVRKSIETERGPALKRAVEARAA